MRISEKPNKFYIIRKVLMRAIQKCSFIEFGLLCEKLWSFFLSNFGSHQIWSCHETQNASFENFLFCLILHLISEKVTKFLVKSSQLQKLPAKNLSGGGKHPSPVPLGLTYHPSIRFVSYFRVIHSFNSPSVHPSLHSFRELFLLFSSIHWYGK